MTAPPDSPFNLTVRLFGLGAMPAPEDDILETMLAVGAIAILAAYALLRDRMLRISKGRWRLAAAVPLAGCATWVGVLVLRPDLEKDPSEVLVLEVMAACCLGMIYLWLLRRSGVGGSIGSKCSPEGTSESRAINDCLLRTAALKLRSSLQVALPTKGPKGIADGSSGAQGGRHLPDPFRILLPFFDVADLDRDRATTERIIARLSGSTDIAPMQIELHFPCLTLVLASFPGK
jgi:hypothetical protein